MLTFEGEQFQGAANIVQKLVSLPFQKVQHQVIRLSVVVLKELLWVWSQVIKADCQPNPSNNGVMVFVTGNLLVDDNQNPLKFGQVVAVGRRKSW